MASGKSLDLREIPRRTREWVPGTVLTVPDTRTGQPQPANRAERRAAERGRAWYGNPNPTRMTAIQRLINAARGNG